MHDKREEQLQHEIETDTEAQAARLRALIDAAKGGDVELPRAHALIGRMAAQVAECIASAAAVKTRGLGGKYKGWVRALPTDVAAVIAIRECIRMCTSPETFIHVQDLAFNVGKLWELEVRIRQAEEVNPMYMQRVHDQVKERCSRDYGHLRRLYGVAVDRVFKGAVDLSLTRMEMIQIGKFGVDACYEAGLIDTVRGVNKCGTTVSYILAPEIYDFLRSYTPDDVRGIIAKDETRMLCPPDHWTNLADGGYLSVRRKAVAPLLNVRKLRKSAREHVAREFTAENMPQVFKCANFLQSVPFSMHAPTRDAIVRLWRAGGGVLGVPKTTPPERPAFPFAAEWVKDGAPEDELQVFNLWKRTVAAHYDEMREWRGRVREAGAFVKSTREAAGPYWFPVHFDTRSRWYYRGVPNPQGSDLAKAVLHFHEKRPLGPRGLFWLRVHIANSAGYDKERLADRAKWTEANWESISRALDAPEDHPDVWGTDAPWCMFSACWELREALRSGNPEAYCTGVPVHMDATCSGLQHYSALLRDPVGGLYVNLSDPDKIGPKQDIYRRVADNAIDAVRADLNAEDAELRDMAAWVLDVGIPRVLAKKPVMTYVYGATLRGTAEYVESTLNREILPSTGKAWPDPVLSFKYSMYIAQKLFQGIAAAVPAAAAAMQWLQSIAKRNPAGERMQWRTPTGFLVQHDYQDYTDHRVRLNSCGVQLVWVREWNGGTRQHAMANAISPNFVHALDASHLTMVANKMADDGIHMVGIHDSYGTHPCDVDRMHEHIRREFVNLYNRPNLLATFLWDVGATAEIPERGSLNLEDVLTSEFMFC